jgi:hypothetical protein
MWPSVAAAIVLTIAGFAGARSASAEDRSVAYEAQYTLVGFLLRATNVCGGSKEHVDATFSLLDAEELKAFSRSFPGLSEQWMNKGAGLFNTEVLKDGIPNACQHALEVLKKAAAIPRK